MMSLTESAGRKRLILNDNISTKKLFTKNLNLEKSHRAIIAIAQDRGVYVKKSDKRLHLKRQKATTKYEYVQELVEKTVMK